MGGGMGGMGGMGGGMGGMGGADMGNTYGLSPQFLASLNIQGPLHTRVFVANMDYTIDERKLKEVKTLVCSPIHLMFALISLLLAPCSLLLAPCSLLLAPSQVFRLAGRVVGVELQRDKEGKSRG